ncbi:MAG: hypothetical protein HHJ10_01205 [Cellulomonas sp.]|uniref:hypothetical protein n=1 Tax=Cellulomonas sp. TaxID=40001 RepID=UPI0017FA6335|nr:hypothetical protein [Cellulomonas sp.]NMM29687.1 hypothetical protein [Cellulomonas sp.]
MEFVLNGEARSLDRGSVERALGDVDPEPVREHGVRVGGVVYPVKQAFAGATGIPRAGFTSQTARRLLVRLGFEVTGHTSPRPTLGQMPGARNGATTPAAVSDPHGWPWEGRVQTVFADYLRANGWSVTSMADTAKKATGVDVLARKGARNLGAEVKGWPSRTYSDPRRSDEVKPTQPGNQAGHWFSQAVVKGLMLLDSHPGYESLVVVPDYPRYRDLAHRTRTGRAAAGVHVVLVSEDGSTTCDPWTP